MAALVTILFAIAGGTFGKGDGPSFIGEEKLAAAPAPVIPAPRAADDVPAVAVPAARPLVPAPRG
jgi:hypothetical protein